MREKRNLVVMSTSLKLKEVIIMRPWPTSLSLRTVVKQAHRRVNNRADVTHTLDTQWVRLG